MATRGEAKPSPDYPKKTMAVKIKVMRLGHMCRIIYGFSVVFVAIYIIHGTYLLSKIHYTSKATKDSTGFFAAIRKLFPGVRSLQRHRGPPKPFQPSGRLFAPRGQKFETTFQLMQSHNNSKPGHGGALFCDKNFEIVNSDIVYLHNVSLNISKKLSKSKGGETIKTVLNQKETDEFVVVLNGFFMLPCKKLPKIKLTEFGQHSIYSYWFSGIQATNRTTREMETVSNFTVLRRRGDYANLYWTFVELYDTYLTIKLLGEDPKSSTIIIMDSHPNGKLDRMWNIIFGNVVRIGNIEKDTSFENLAWSINGLSSPISQSVPVLPLVRDFKKLFYSSIGEPSDEIDMCSETEKNITITLILRKNYVAHPRNPSGHIMRKISNERPLIGYLESKFANYTFRAVQLDSMPIEDQMRLIAKTTVLIGVHGAGLAYTLLLRPGSAAIELFPSLYKGTPNRHFEQFSVWGGVHYFSWYSMGHASRIVEWLAVPPSVVEEFIQKALNKICKIVK